MLAGLFVAVASLQGSLSCLSVIAVQLHEAVILTHLILDRGCLHTVIAQAEQKRRKRCAGRSTSARRPAGGSDKNQTAINQHAHESRMAPKKTAVMAGDRRPPFDALRAVF